MRFHTIAAKVSVVIICMILLCAMAVGVSASLLYRGDSIDASARHAADIAQSAAAAIDGDEMADILLRGEKSDHWHAVKRTMDKIKVQTGVTYLYVLDGTVDNSGYMRYFAEGIDAMIDEEELDLGALEESSAYADELFETLRTGSVTTTDVYDSTGFGKMVSGFSAVLDSDGRVVGVVGVDWSVDHVMAATRSFVLRIVLIVLVCCAVFAAVSATLLTRTVGRPINALTEIADRIAEGDVDCEIDIRSHDEIGRLANAFSRMVESTKQQAQLLESLAGGDLTIQAGMRSDKDLMNRSISHTVRGLNRLVSEVLHSTGQVAAASAQIAQAAQNLASGSSQQAATLEEFSATVTLLLDQSQTNAQQSTDTSADIQAVGSLMRQSTQSMERMTGAMSAINESSDNISRVIKVIEDIAFQTNILALNASVEAARAGQHGKGFAVVADEVRNLASKSAEAARETTSMIENSIARVTEGDAIVRETHRSIQSVGEITGRSAGAMEFIAGASQQQCAAISEINEGINQLAVVVQQNAATAQEAAATSQQMAAQAAMLQEIVSRFKVVDMHLQAQAYQRDPA